MGSSSGRQFVHAIFCMVCFSRIYASSLVAGRVCPLPTMNVANNIKYCNKFHKIWELFGILEVLVDVEVFVAVCMCEVKIYRTFKRFAVPT